MRKRFKNKKESCALCKPHKRGWAVRWNSKQAELLRIFEKEKTFLLQMK